MSKIHVSFKENDQYRQKGWISFYTHYPEGMARIGNKFFSIKDGQVWEHNDIDNSQRNYFYGVKHESKINFFVTNPENMDSIYKTVKIEGNTAWSLTIKTNYSEGHLREDEFSNIESYFYTHFRKNETIDDFHGFKIQGVGDAISFEMNPDWKVFFDYIPDNIEIGDLLYYNKNDVNKRLGTIINITDSFIQIEPEWVPFETDTFYFVSKDARITGAEIRGYYSEITLSNNSDKPIELYALNLNLVKSYV